MFINRPISTHTVSNKAIFEKLFFDYYHDLCNYAYTYLNDEMLAEDIVQSFFKELWEKGTFLTIKKNKKSYLFKSIRNDCLDFLKSRFAQTSFESFENIEIETDESGFDYANHEKLLVLIDEAIKQLPSKCKIIFRLSRFSEMKHKEIAEELNLSLKTVENQIGIAIKRIKEHIFVNLNN